jgi:hypothetical protein
MMNEGFVCIIVNDTNKHIFIIHVLVTCIHYNDMGMKHSDTYLSSSLVPKYVKYAAVKHEHYLGPALNMIVKHEHYLGPALNMLQ